MPHTVKDASNVHDEKPASLPLLATEDPTRKPSPLARLFEAIWNSCTCCSLLNAFLLAANAIALKLLTDDGMSVFQVLAFRSVIALPFFIPLAYYRTKTVFGPMHAMKWIIAGSVWEGITFIFGCFSLALMDVSVATFLNNSYPALLAFLVAVLRIESIDWLSWLGILGTVASNVLIAKPPFLTGESEEWTMDETIGVLCAFICMSSISLALIIMAKIDLSVPPMIVSNHSLIQMLLISILFLAVGFPDKMIWELSLRQIGILMIGGVSTIGQIFIMRACQIGTSLKAGMVSLTRMLMITAGGALILHEHISLLQGLGAALMLSSIALVMWRRDLAQKRRAAAESVHGDPFEVDSGLLTG